MKVFNKSIHAIPMYTTPNTRIGCLIIAWTVNIILYRDRRQPCWLMVIAGPQRKMVLLSGNFLDSWRQVFSPFWKWQLMAAAPTLVYFGLISVNFHHVILVNQETH